MTVYSPVPLGAADDLLALAAVTMLALAFVLFEKAVATNVSSPAYRQLARSLDVVAVPLAVAWVALGVTQLSRVIGAGS